jgi:hypothetical protein
MSLDSMDVTWVRLFWSERCRAGPGRAGLVVVWLGVRRLPSRMFLVSEPLREEARDRGEGPQAMAQTGCVFDVAAPDEPRTPEQVMASRAGGGKQPPRALRRWYTVDIAADRAYTAGVVFDEAGRRDPGHARTWIAAKPCPTWRTSSRTWTTPEPWRTAGRSPPASSKAPAGAITSTTGWASPAPAGA